MRRLFKKCQFSTHWAIAHSSQCFMTGENEVEVCVIMPVGWKEGNVLFNDALNTFYFTVIWRRTYGKGPLR